MKHYIALLLTIVLSVSSALPVRAQEDRMLEGVVRAVNADGKKEPVSFATVYWAGSDIYADCDGDGHFSIRRGG